MKDLYKDFVLTAVLFLALLIFYRVHPLVLYDTDDYIQFIRYRNAYPVWKLWNPIKVLPETLMPLCGDFAGFILYPITHNLPDSFTIVTVLTVSVFILLYMHGFQKLMLAVGIVCYRRLLIAGLFLLHFAIFQTASNGMKPYLFGAHNVSCIYHYVIPVLLNGIVVLWFLFREINGTYEETVFKKGILYFVIYLSIFSNLYCKNKL